MGKNYQVTRQGFYALADNPTQGDLDRIGVSRYTPRVMAKWTGDYRKPRAGEWFLSGAEVEAYRASNDLGMEHHIATLVMTETVIREKK